VRAYETVSAARSGIGHYLDFYNAHSGLDGSMPDAFYYRHPHALEQAA